MTPKSSKALRDAMVCITCPRDKKGLKHFKITCTNCKSLVGECWAENIQLDNYCNFHYICEAVLIKKDHAEWRGALAINLSPIDFKIGVECACGLDTRDFRGNNSLKGEDFKRKLAETMLGRDMGKSNSKYKVSEIA